MIDRCREFLQNIYLRILSNAIFWGEKLYGRPRECQNIRTQHFLSGDNAITQPFLRYDITVDRDDILRNAIKLIIKMINFMTLLQEDNIFGTNGSLRQSPQITKTNVLSK